MAKASQQMIDRVRGHMFSNRQMSLTSAQLQEDLDISYSSANAALNALIEEELVDSIEVEGQRGFEYQWAGENDDALQELKEEVHAFTDNILDRVFALGRETATEDVSEALQQAISQKFTQKNGRAQA